MPIVFKISLFEIPKFIITGNESYFSLLNISMFSVTGILQHLEMNLSFCKEKNYNLLLTSSNKVN
jgi:hypothetical protein